LCSFCHGSHPSIKHEKRKQRRDARRQELQVRRAGHRD
jgi:hypothetical protein